MLERLQGIMTNTELMLRVTSGVLALIIVITICYMYIARIPVPETLTNISLLIFGYYFGAYSSTRTQNGKVTG